MANKTVVSSFGLKVLQKLASGTKARWLEDGSLVLGHIQVPGSLIRNLERADLLVKVGERNITISETGLLFLRRRQSTKPQVNKYGYRTKPNEDFGAQHRKAIKQEFKVGKKKKQVLRNIGDSPLAWLMQRKDKEGRRFITQDHFDAGERLCRDYEFAGLISRTVGHYDGVPISRKRYYSGSGDSPTVTQLAAKKRVQLALDYVGPGLSDILVRVCCYREGLELAERTLAWPNRSAKLVLRFALDRLAKHYNQKN